MNDPTRKKGCLNNNEQLSIGKGKRKRRRQGAVHIITSGWRAIGREYNSAELYAHLDVPTAPSQVNKIALLPSFFSLAVQFHEEQSQVNGWSAFACALVFQHLSQFFITSFFECSQHPALKYHFCQTNLLRHLLKRV